MKNLLLVIFVLLCSTTAYSTPMYYVFEGSISSIKNPDNVDLSQYGINSSAVEYVLQFDFARQGEYTNADGTKYTYSDDVFESFYVDYISGDAITIPGYGNYREYNFGSEEVFIYNNELRYSINISVNDSNDRLDIYRYGLYTQDTNLATNMAIGDKFNFKDRFDDQYLGNPNAYISGSLTLTSIRSVPVPEPATIYLLCSSMIFFICLKRKLGLGALK